MENLWTPWRFRYLTERRNDTQCVFCRIAAEAARDREHLVLGRRTHTFTVLNRFPYTSGHLLVATYRHVAWLAEASDQELAELALEARRCEQALRQVYRPDGFNVGFNLGSCAGAGVAGHLHLHVVPRWVGDANFVSVVGETRVIPEELPATWEKLRPHFQTAEIA
jgi:ATP adenylyltransferase